MEKAVELDERGSGVGARRDHLHRRDVQECREADLRQGRLARGPFSIFNASLDGNVRRAIDILEGDKIDEKALKALIRAAVELNISVRATAPVRSRKRPKSA